MRTVDLFAGLGGFTQGAEDAGAHVVWAANHWPIAVDAHTLNHPHVEHVCQDLMQADWTRLPAYDLLCASPSCVGHSNASRPKRGPQHEAMRTTAWAVVQCVEVTRPLAFVVENVPEFMRWELFRIWCMALRKLGYFLSVQTLLASRCGVPQRRKRVVIVGHQKRAIHVRELGTPEPAFGPYLDVDADGWRPIAEAGPDARQRMEAASTLHGRCLVQHVTGHKGIPLSEPIRTITTMQHWCEVNGDMYRWLTPREMARGMSFPDTYRLPEGIAKHDAFRLVGNAIPPLLAKTAVAQVIAAS
jgi:DNA (cytosine-5)-methyltransferase 1